MRIVVLGWGSLIWYREHLPVSGQWFKDGPWLPIEFARISDNGRLTLVILPGVDRVQTLWAQMNSSNLEEAIKELAKREHTPNENNIGFLEVKSGRYRCNTDPTIVNEVKKWAEERNIETVIWTDLQTNFSKKTNMVLNGDNAIKYLESLSDPEKKSASHKYIRNAPSQIQTRIRKSYQQKYGN